MKISETTKIKELIIAILVYLLDTLFRGLICYEFYIWFVK